MATLEKSSGVPHITQDDITLNSAGGTANQVIIAVLNAEIVMAPEGRQTAMIDMRGTFVGTLTFAYSVDGVNFQDAPVMQEGGSKWLPGASAVGTYFAYCPGAQLVRVRCTAYTSGSIITTLRATNVPRPFVAVEPVEPLRVLGGINSVTTLTIPAGGVNLFTFLTSLTIKAINGSAVAVAGSALITTANTNTVIQTTFDNTFAAWSTRTLLDWQPPSPIRTTTANTLTNIVVPALGAGMQAEIIATFKYGR